MSGEEVVKEFRELGSYIFTNEKIYVISVKPGEKTFIGESFKGIQSKVYYIKPNAEQKDFANIGRAIAIDLDKQETILIEEKLKSQENVLLVRREIPHDICKILGLDKAERAITVDFRLNKEGYFVYGYESIIIK